MSAHTRVYALKMNGLPKIHKENTKKTYYLTYNLAIFLVHFLKPLTSNQFTVHDLFSSIKIEANCMAIFDVEYLFTNLLLEETINFCLDRLNADTE